MIGPAPLDPVSRAFVHTLRDLSWVERVHHPRAAQYSRPSATARVSVRYAVLRILHARFTLSSQ